MEKETSASKYGRYRANLSRVFSEVNIQGYGEIEEIKRVLDLARSYYDDAAHFKGKGEIETALISLAYSEGLLDGLRLMGHIQFKWSEE